MRADGLHIRADFLRVDDCSEGTRSSSRGVIHRILRTRKTGSRGLFHCCTRTPHKVSSFVTRSSTTVECKARTRFPGPQSSMNDPPAQLACSMPTSLLLRIDNGKLVWRSKMRRSCRCYRLVKFYNSNFICFLEKFH